MHAEPQIELKIAQAAQKRELQAFLLVAACLSLVLAVYFPTFLEMVQIWNRSGTFTHGWLVLPAFLYFVWQRREELATTPIRPFAPALVLAGAAGFVWLMGELSSSLTPSFFAVIGLVPVVITGLLGWRWTWALAFPMAFLFFAVPFGEVFVPTLIDWTADFTVMAIRASGVPVFREGNSFVIPSGRWSVVDACSGIRYLLASMFVGALYAWQVYRSPLRRALFFAAAILVPIVANWVRAYLIVMLGHLTDNRLAAGVDHLIYGWIFFGAVMILMFAVGAVWREDHDAPAAPRPSALARAPISWMGDGHWRLVGVAGVLAAIMLAWPVAGAILTQPQAIRPVGSLAFSTAAGWVPVAEELAAWRPELKGATAERAQTFAKGDQRVGLFVGVYRGQRQGAELVNAMNMLLSDYNPEWIRLAAGSRQVEFVGQPLTVRTERLRGRNGTLVAWQWYWLRDSSTSSDARAKLQLVADRLLGRDDTSAWVAVFAVDPENAATAERALAAFISEMGGVVDAALHEAARR